MRHAAGEAKLPPRAGYLGPNNATFRPAIPDDVSSANRADICATDRSMHGRPWLRRWCLAVDAGDISSISSEIGEAFRTRDIHRLPCTKQARCASAYSKVLFGYGDLLPNGGQPLQADIRNFGIGHPFVVACAGHCLVARQSRPCARVKSLSRTARRPEEWCDRLDADRTDPLMRRGYWPGSCRHRRAASPPACQVPRRRRGPGSPRRRSRRPPG
jgi:hypothetical protein